MNRRNFLRGLAAAPVVMKLAPASSLFPETVGDYVDYSNFSELARAEALTEAIQQSAVELGYRAGLSISTLYASVCEQQ